MRRARPAILLTGFGPFPGVPRNASATFAIALAVRARAAFPDWTIGDAVLPTEWRAGPSHLRAIYREVAPCLALHFGVSARAQGFVIETRARNETDGACDARGALPGHACVVEGGAAVCSVTIPTARILERLRAAGFPASLSDDAGGYLCNAVLYHALVEESAARVGFVHLPAGLDGGEIGLVGRVETERVRGRDPISTGDEPGRRVSQKGSTRPTASKPEPAPHPNPLPKRKGRGNLSREGRRRGSPGLTWDDALTGGLVMIAACLEDYVEGDSVASALSRSPDD